MRDWTEQRIETALKLWREGLSASLIATQLGGTSRSAVLGKLHRMKVDLHRDVPRRRKKAGVPRSRKRRQPSGLPLPTVQSAFAAALAAAPLEPLPPMTDKPAPAGQRRSLVELEPHHCRWPIGDVSDADFHFCGAQRVSGLSYCLPHARRAYQPPQPRRSVPVSVPVKQTEGV